MMDQKMPGEYYREKSNQLQATLHQLQKKQSLLGWLRLSVLLLSVIMAYQLFAVSLFAGWITIIVGIVLFLGLVSFDTDNNHRIRRMKKQLELTEDERKVLANDFHHRFDGAAFQPPEHPYAGDLDLFGKASIFQYINRCSSEQGKRLLATNLLHPLSLLEAGARQEAVRELIGDHQWRMDLAVLSAEEQLTEATGRRAIAWVEGREDHFTSKSWTYIIPVYSVLATASAIACMVGWIPLNLFGGIFLLYFIFSSSLSRRAMKSYLHLNGIVPQIRTLESLLQHGETRTFKSPLLQSWQQSVGTKNGKGYRQIAHLKEILNRFDLRLNVLLFIILNSLWLWDVRQVRALNRWRETNRTHVGGWFQAVGELEVLGSLATLHFNQPAWVFPRFSENKFHFSATALGHPLIPGGHCVVNDFLLEGTGKVALVTGSNMAGKSTFLRSLGLNTVLAFVGAPICARAFQVSSTRIMSSMRIADNLSENTSTFYAELKKLKTIIEAVNRKEAVLVLLDEVLRGTNSLDRHIGLEALIRQFIRQDAVAVVATHDVEVAGLEKEYPRALQNYHFDVQVQGEELYFDYRLKKGVCTSLNASILMKKIGIELG
jgi:hypothetical protein